MIREYNMYNMCFSSLGVSVHWSIYGYYRQAPFDKKAIHLPSSTVSRMYSQLVGQILFMVKTVQNGLPWVIRFVQVIFF